MRAHDPLESTLDVVRLAALAAVAVTSLSGCDSAPRNQFVQWVVRDAWDMGCASQAAVEKFSIDGRRWSEVAGQKVYVVDVDATFKLMNSCKTGIRQATYKQFESVPFAEQGIKMVACERTDERGKRSEGWALLGQEADRCWTGPNPPGPDRTPAWAREKPKVPKTVLGGDGEAPSDPEKPTSATPAPPAQ